MARKLKSFSRPKGGSPKKSYDMIIAKRRKGALEIQFNRPDRLNTINEEMAEDIMHAMDAVELDRNIIAVVLSGDARAFCAGADLGGFQDLPDDRYDNYGARYNQRKNRLLYRFLMNYTRPVISAVEGYCLGGGFEMAMMGDFIVASESASFGLPEGNGSHGDMTLDQFLHMRPLPGYAQYKSPVEGLYLCGAGAHPGGGVTGLPGHNAAREILRATG